MVHEHKKYYEVHYKLRGKVNKKPIIATDRANAKEVFLLDAEDVVEVVKVMEQGESEPKEVNNFFMGWLSNLLK